MFSGELLTAALMLFAYDRNDINLVDPAVRAVLNYQASLEGPMHHEKFIDMVANVVESTTRLSLSIFSLVKRRTRHRFGEVFMSFIRTN